mmetsp:Transcript_47980/g.133826  ORF Transcript_47980/g.133826 Transcript_47980/m.133826 type:complete len:106 (-) Transcript_47980:184-501(-)
MKGKGVGPGAGVFQVATVVDSCQCDSNVVLGLRATAPPDSKVVDVGSWDGIGTSEVVAVVAGIASLVDDTLATRNGRVCVAKVVLKESLSESGGRGLVEYVAGPI